MCDFFFTKARRAINKKAMMNTSEDVGKQDLLFDAGGNTSWWSWEECELVGNQYIGFSKILKIQLLYDPTTLTLSIYSKVSKSAYHLCVYSCSVNRV